MTQRRIALIICALCAAASLAMIGLYLSDLDRPLGERQKAVYEYGGDFHLKTANNGKIQTISLKDFQGKVLIIYFGFTNCTEACPESMLTLKTAFNRLSPEQLKHTAGLFVSVDPERDTLEDLAEFTQYFHPDILGATADEATIKALASQYGVYFKLEDLDGSQLDYTVDHASRFYIVDQTGRLVTTMSHSTTAAELTAKIQQLLNQGTSP